MPEKVAKEQQKVWDRLKYVPPKPRSGAWAYGASHIPPSSASPGSVYFDTNSEHMMLYDGTSWQRIS